MVRLNVEQFSKFIVQRVHKLSPTVSLVTIAPEDSSKIEPLPVCYSLSLANMDCSEQRPYTPINLIEDYSAPLKNLDILVRQYPNGIISGFLCSRNPGDVVNVRGPFIKVDINDVVCKYERLGLIAGGTGITPMLQIIRFVLQRCEKTVMTLLFGNVNDSEVLLRDELNVLAAKHPNRFTVHYTVGPEMTEEMIKTVMPGPDDPSSMLFVSGPPGMMKAVGGGGRKEPLGGILGRLGYTHVHKY